MKASRIIPALILSFLTVSSCYFNKKLENISLNIYQESAYDVNPIIALSEDGIQEILIHLPADTFIIELKGFESFQSSSQFFDFREEGEIIYNANPWFRLPIPEKNFDYQLLVTVIGRHTDIHFKDLITVDYSVSTIDPHVQLLDKMGLPYSKNVLPVNESLFLDCETAKKREILVEYYSDQTIPALPPFSENAKPFKLLNEPDDLFETTCGKPFTFNAAGLYRVVAENSRYRLVYCSPPEFPKVTNVDDLSLSLRYITKNIEYQAIRQSEDPKQALDEFWLDRTSSKERSRKLIRIYYNRIQQANRYFTRFKQGWKTDRGMIYTVFGVPEKVEKAPLYEYWYYEPTDYRDEATFFFDRMLNGEMVLRRSEYLERPWNSQVLMWRQGITK